MHRESRSPHDSQDLSATAEEEPVGIHTGDVGARTGRTGVFKVFRDRSRYSPLLTLPWRWGGDQGEALLQGRCSSKGAGIPPAPPTPLMSFSLRFHFPDFSTFGRCCRTLAVAFHRGTIVALLLGTLLLVGYLVFPCFVTDACNGSGEETSPRFFCLCIGPACHLTPSMQWNYHSRRCEAAVGSLRFMS
jgi:hypothetical protein